MMRAEVILRADLCRHTNHTNIHEREEFQCISACEKAGSQSAAPPSSIFLITAVLLTLSSVI